MKLFVTSYVCLCLDQDTAILPILSLHLSFTPSTLEGKAQKSPRVSGPPYLAILSLVR
jgi:hypothetical protein